MIHGSHGSSLLVRIVLQRALLVGRPWRGQRQRQRLARIVLRTARRRGERRGALSLIAARRLDRLGLLLSRHNLVLVAVHVVVAEDPVLNLLALGVGRRVCTRRAAQ